MADTFQEAEVAIIGGGLGGVAAALAAADAGRSVVLTAETDWIGGQVTAQAVSALDEPETIEAFGGTRRYYQFREGVRAAYKARYPAFAGIAQLNPGNSWVSRLSFEPKVGLRVLEGMLAGHIAARRVRILLQHRPLSARVQQGRIREVLLAGPGDSRVTLRASYFLDATELGDLLPLSSAPYASGAEAFEDTGEPHAARDGPHPERGQSFTHCFLVEYCPGQNYTIRKPYGYEYYRSQQPFTLTLDTPEHGKQRYAMFSGKLPFWTYRRLFDAALFAPGNPEVHDVALINWEANDYYKENLIDRSPAQHARILQEARRLSLSFLYWLQTEAPHDADNGHGYPGLRLLPEAAGTPDGLAKAPYIRKSRRLVAYRRVLEQDIIPQAGRGVRAAHFADSAGIGWYPIDLHRCAGDAPEGKEKRVTFERSLPFQIPLGALLSPAVDNLIAAAKNIGTTHITNGAYRLHPVEWAIGEAAGALAAFALAQGQSPRLVWETPPLLRRFQQGLLAQGIPLNWTMDVPLTDPDFVTLQTSLLTRALPARSPRKEQLQLHPDAPLTRGEGAWLVENTHRLSASPYLAGLLAVWESDPQAPFTGADWSAACMALDLPSPNSSEAPTLRKVVKRLADLAD